MSAKKRLRTIAMLVTLVTALFVGAVGTAHAQGIAPQQLDSHNWTCYVPPPRPDLIVCYNHGLGRPSPTDPDPAPAYSLIAFSSASGEFLYTSHLVRADLYNGRPCAPGAEPYVFLALLGYYECAHP
jgi:hypothetical protein